MVSNYLLLNIIIYFDKISKLKLFNLVSKRCRLVTQTIKIDDSTKITKFINDNFTINSFKVVDGNIKEIFRYREDDLKEGVKKTAKKYLSGEIADNAINRESI